MWNINPILTFNINLSTCTITSIFSSFLNKELTYLLRYYSISQARLPRPAWDVIILIKVLSGKIINVQSNYYGTICFLFKKKSFFASVVGFSLYPKIFYFITMVLQRIRILREMPDSNPGPLPQKYGALPMSHKITICIWQHYVFPID